MANENNARMYTVDKVFTADDGNVINYKEVHLVVGGEDFLISPKFKDDKRFFMRIVNEVCKK